LMIANVRSMCSSDECLKLSCFQVEFKMRTFLIALQPEGCQVFWPAGHSWTGSFSLTSPCFQDCSSLGYAAFRRVTAIIEPQRRKHACIFLHIWDDFW
jgi:hypothetical protein